MACKQNCKMVKSVNLPFAHWAFPSGCAIMWMMLTGKLDEHLKEIGDTAQEMFDQLVAQMKDAEGVTERLKAENQMEWVGRMNSIRSRAEEVVLFGLVYC